MRDYACIMLDYEQPNFIKEIQKSIPKEDLYLGETDEDIKNNSYGIEDESHITICYGLENSVKFNDIKEYLFDIKKYNTILVNISTFKNDKFDVLKVDAKCPKAAESNKSISKNFEIHSEYKEFKAHMTIAYMKKGKADKYCKDILDKIEDMLPYRFNYSFTKNGKDVNEFYEKI